MAVIKAFECIRPDEKVAACEEAARIILSENRPFSMETAACDEEYEPSSEYDSSFALQIFAAREAVFKILAKESLSIHEKLIVILDMGSKIQHNNCEVCDDCTVLVFGLFDTYNK